MAIKIKQEPISLDDEDEDEEALRLAALQSLKVKQVLKQPAATTSASAAPSAHPLSLSNATATSCRPPLAPRCRMVTPPRFRPSAMCRPNMAAGPFRKPTGVLRKPRPPYMTNQPAFRGSTPQTEFQRHTMNPNLISIVPVGDDQPLKSQKQFVTNLLKQDQKSQELRPLTKSGDAPAVPQLIKPFSNTSKDTDKTNVPSKFSRIDASDSESDDDVPTDKKNSSEDEADDGNNELENKKKSVQTSSVLEDDSLENLMAVMEQEMNETPVVQKSSNSNDVKQEKSNLKKKKKKKNIVENVQQIPPDVIEKKVLSIKKEKEDPIEKQSSQAVMKIEKNVESEQKKAIVDIAKPACVEPLKVKVEPETTDAKDIQEAPKNTILEKVVETSSLSPIRIKSPIEVNSQLKQEPLSPVREDRTVETINRPSNAAISPSNNKLLSPSKSTCSSPVEFVERSPVSPITVENSPRSDRTDLLDEKEFPLENDKSNSPRKLSPSPVRRSKSPLYKPSSRSAPRSPSARPSRPSPGRHCRDSERAASPPHRLPPRGRAPDQDPGRSYSRNSPHYSGSISSLPLSSSNRPASPHYNPYLPPPTSRLNPRSPPHNSYSPPYGPTSPSYTPASPSYRPSYRRHQSPTSPPYCPSDPCYNPRSPSYYGDLSPTRPSHNSNAQYMNASTHNMGRPLSGAMYGAGESEVLGNYPRHYPPRPPAAMSPIRRSSWSPRRRSRSPRRLSRSRSPRRRSRSPWSPSSRSPRRLYRSPGRLSRSPRRLSRSPRGLSRSPKRLSRSPRRFSRSPRRISRSPRRMSQSPRRLSRSPIRHNRSPRRLSRSPRRQSISPKRFTSRRQSPWNASRVQNPVPNRRYISRSPSPHRLRRNSTSPKRVQHVLPSKRSPVPEGGALSRQRSPQLRASLSPRKRSHSRSPGATAKAISPSGDKRLSLSPRRKSRVTRSSRSPRKESSPRRETSPRKYEISQRFRQKSLSPVHTNYLNAESRHRQSSMSPKRKDPTYEKEQAIPSRRYSPSRRRQASSRNHPHAGLKSRSPPRKTSPLQTQYRSTADKWGLGGGGGGVEQKWSGSNYQAARRPAQTLPSKSLSPPAIRDSTRQRSRSPVHNSAEYRTRRRSPYANSSRRRDVPRRRDLVDRNRDRERERDRRDRRRDNNARGGERMRERSREDPKIDDEKRTKDTDNLGNGNEKTEPEDTQEKEAVISDPVMEARRRKFESKDLVQPISKKICLKSKSSADKVIDSPELTFAEEISSTEKLLLGEDDHVDSDSREDKREEGSDEQLDFQITDRACSTEDVLDLGADGLLLDWEEELSDWNRKIEVSVNKKAPVKQTRDKETDLRNKVSEKRRHKHKIVMDKASSPVGRNKRPTTVKRKKTSPRGGDRQPTEEKIPELLEEVKQKEEVKPNELEPSRDQLKEDSHEDDQKFELKEDKVDDFESKDLSEDCDLRAELSRRRAERLTKAGSLHETLPKRLLQSAFQGLIGLNRMESKAPKAKESKQATVVQSKIQPVPKKKTEMPSEAGKRRVLLLKRNKPSRKQSFQIGLKLTKECDTDSLPSYSEDESEEQEVDSAEQSASEAESDDAQSEELLAMKRKQLAKREREQARERLPVKCRLGSALDVGLKKKRKFFRGNQVRKSPSVNIDMHAPSSKKKVSIGLGLKTSRKTGKSNKLTLLY